MRKKKLWAKLMAAALSAAMVLSLMPVSALAVTGSQVAADGTYSASEKTANDDDAFTDYEVTVSLTVEDGTFSAVEVTTGEDYDDDNDTYFDYAVNSRTKSNGTHYPGVVEALVGEAATADTIEGWDSVTGATYTSEAIKTAALAALETAEEADTDDDSDTDDGDTDNGDTDDGDTDDGDTDDGDTDDGDTDDALTVTIPEGLTDGTYTGGATVYHDDGEQFSDYPITVSVSVSNGTLLSFSVSGASGNNAQYSTKAENGLNEQLANSAAGSYEVDAVSTATCSSKGIVEAINAALVSEPTSTSVALGSAIYDSEGTSFTVTITNPVSGVDYSDITLAYAVGKFSQDLDESAYSVELTSESDDEAVYTVTVAADSGTDIEDEELTHSVTYNNVGMALYVTVAGTTIGSVTIESGATYAIVDNVLTVTGGNGETLADYIDAVSELAFSYVDEDTGETVTESYTLQWQHDVEPEYTGSDIFNEDGSINFDCALFVYGESGAYTMTLTATGYNDVTATVGNVVCYYMNVPYSVFYAELNDDGDVDTVTSATTSKAANCKNVYLTVDSDEGTTSIYGVVVPVKMSVSVYETIADLVTDSTADYYVGEEVEDPVVYLELTDYEDGAYTFSEIQSTAEKTTATVDGELTSSSTWGDYELDLDSDYGIAPTYVYGVYFTTSDGAQYAMKQSENMWTPSNYYEAAWDTIDNDYYSSMEGKTITKVTYITTYGIVEYTLSDSQYVTPHMENVPDVVFLSDGTIYITGIADDAENVTVTVRASGRNGTSLTDEAKSIAEDGTVTLDTAATDGTTYKVTISSSNYATNIISLVYRETYYAYMNVPYSVFYAELNDDGDVDTVTSATTSKAANCKNVYLTVDSDAGTTSIYGVVIPVAMSTADYAAVKNLVTDSTAAYYVGEEVEDPVVYLELTDYESGAYTFSEIQSTADVTTATVEGELTSESTWGDYELDLDSDYGIAPTDVYGVYFTTSDGTEYAMKQSENMWTPSNYYEAAWDTIDNEYYSSMEGKTITTVTYITTYGIVEYTLSESQYVTPHMDNVPDVVFLDGETIYITGIAADAENVTVTVRASGRNGTSLTDEAKSIAEDGTVTLDTAATDGTTYKVTISSSNYATNIISLVYRETYYAYMNVPYSVFYAELNDDGDVDTVTSATTSKAANCKNVYLTVDSDAGTTSIYGVVIPVAMSTADYAAVKDLVNDSTAVYYVGEEVEDPVVYLELTGYENTVSAFSTTEVTTVNGEYTFSGIQSTADKTTATVDGELTSSSTWGDYELDLDSDYGIAPTYVYGVYLTTSDGAEYALKQSEHLWTPSKYYEAAWDTIDNDYYSSMEGKTITTVTYITTYGIVEYTLSESQYVTPHMENVPTVVFIDGETIYITGIADDAEGVTVTVKASGRNGASLTDDAKTIADDGTVALDTAATDGTTYKVTISSSNYATNIVSVVYSGVDKSALKTAYDAALALNESDYTVSSWNAFETALASAAAVLTDEDATQEEVNSAEA
ncbi:MAG: FMN-binding protein, partial [Clostridiales bacterium]|nr:FMN-binding protein [Clostridiales bacterium]